MNNIKLVCDSLCDIPKEIIDKYNIEVMPLTIIINGKEYKDGIDITKKEFYNIMKDIEKLPTTSQATYSQFKEVFDKYTAEGKSIIYIAGSSKATGTYQSAMMAKNDTEGNIYLFDSLSLSMGIGQYVLKTCELIDKKVNCDEIMKELEDMRESVNLFFAADTLEYLQKGGRVSITQAAIGNMLNIKPIFTMIDGKNELLHKIRGNKNAINKLVDLIEETCNGKFDDKKIIIGCGINEGDFEVLKRKVESRLPVKEIHLVNGGACICAHTGPKILGISCSI